MDKKIYYHDTDAGGVVYYANYLKYLEEARTEYLESRGENVPKFIEQGFFFAVRSCNVIYKSPARYGETISADANVKKVTGTQIFFHQRILNKATEQVMVEAEVSLVCLTLDFKPRAIPDGLREKLA
ncbi:MAG: YbgC/FadM family acyl-CoA thioesterase [Candidatus Omnitrophica bacterium]|nr:YbgC/FadM family acyl-CoA thioesterase [Candidatus Omnitrophota bacterium]